MELGYRLGPLRKFYAPPYQKVVADFLADKVPVGAMAPVAPNNSLNFVLQFVRAGKDSATRVAAFDIAFAPVKVGAVTAAQLAAQPTLGANVDFVARRILTRLYLDDAKTRGNNFVADPPASDAALAAAILAELRGNLLNSDGVRSFATRRVCVDILKKLQTTAALTVLAEAQQALATGTDAESGDLAKRVSAALSPYFL